MISNIVHKRSNTSWWSRVNAIIEATWHDNTCESADQAEIVDDDREVTYDQREGVTLEEAVLWAQAASGSCPVTLYIYDEGDGTTVAAKLVDGALQPVGVGGKSKHAGWRALFGVGPR